VILFNMVHKMWKRRKDYNDFHITQLDLVLTFVEGPNHH